MEVAREPFEHLVDESVKRGAAAERLRDAVDILQTCPEDHKDHNTYESYTKIGIRQGTGAEARLEHFGVLVGGLCALEVELRELEVRVVQKRGVVAARPATARHLHEPVAEEQDHQEQAPRVRRCRQDISHLPAARTSTRTSGTRTRTRAQSQWHEGDVRDSSFVHTPTRTAKQIRVYDVNLIAKLIKKIRIL